ncbi:MAG: roadblock/LC7 domain-containing protein [Methanocellales archaeon]|nr:roadblock/LC7 domain-containing protein [Methanocellales archaeon]
MSGTIKMFEDALANLKDVNDIRASAVITRSGSLVTEDIPPEIHAESLTAMSATMLSAAEIAISELDQGIANQVIAESNNVKIITMGAGPKMLLVVMANPAVKLDSILDEMRKAADKIKKL